MEHFPDNRDGFGGEHHAHHTIAAQAVLPRLTHERIYSTLHPSSPTKDAPGCDTCNSLPHAPPKSSKPPRHSPSAARSWWQSKPVACALRNSTPGPTNARNTRFVSATSPQVSWRLLVQT